MSESAMKNKQDSEIESDLEQALFLVEWSGETFLTDNF